MNKYLKIAMAIIVVIFIIVAVIVLVLSGVADLGFQIIDP